MWVQTAFEPAAPSLRQNNNKRTWLMYDQALILDTFNLTNHQCFTDSTHHSLTAYFQSSKTCRGIHHQTIRILISCHVVNLSPPHSPHPHPNSHHSRHPAHNPHLTSPSPIPPTLIHPEVANIGSARCIEDQVTNNVMFGFIWMHYQSFWVSNEPYGYYASGER